MEAAEQSLKKGKSAGADNIPGELVQAGGEDAITALTTICNKVWQTGEWPTPWTQSLVITLPKKGMFHREVVTTAFSTRGRPRVERRRRAGGRNGSGGRVGEGKRGSGALGKRKGGGGWKKEEWREGRVENVLQCVHHQ